jgi:hypothetical protein
LVNSANRLGGLGFRRAAREKIAEGQPIEPFIEGEG